MADTLLNKVASGDASAVQEVIDRYGGLVWSLARRFAYNQADAEDAVQEIFVDVWKSAARYDATVASEATFIAMIARRRLIDRRRRAARQPDTRQIQEQLDGDRADGNGLDGSTGKAEVNEEAALASQALSELKPDQQRVLRLSIYQGLSHEKIAEATGLPLGTVKTHVRRGLIRIREILANRKREAGSLSST